MAVAAHRLLTVCNSIVTVSDNLFPAAFWNWAMVATARFLPVEFITDREKIRAFAKCTSPLIRFVDPIIAEKVLPLSFTRCQYCL